jgi:hypothetical protein
MKLYSKHKQAWSLAGLVQAMPLMSAHTRKSQDSQRGSL